MNKEDYNKFYIQGSDHYLIPKDVFIELFNEMNNWKEEAKELNKKYLNAVVDYEITMSDKTELEKQLENYKKLGFKYLQDKNNNLEAQQKEFIEYLENEIYSIEPKGTGINYYCEYDSEEDYISAMKEQSKLNTLKEILSKYKSIIGDDK